MKKVLVFLLLLLPLVANAQTVSLTVPGGTLTPGQTVTATATVTNTLTPQPPVVFGAIGATYINGLGVQQATTSYSWATLDSAGNIVTSGTWPATSMTLTVVQPLAFTQVTLTLGSSLTYVVGSATSSVPVTGTVTNGILTLTFAQTLTEGQKLAITFKVIVV